MQKILPFQHKPPLSYDPTVDELLGILSLYPALYEQKTADNFIDTIIYDNDIADNVSFYGLAEAVAKDCLLCFSMPFEIAQFSISDICGYLVQMLDRDYYVHFLCDTYWVRNYIACGKAHVEHAPLIYGYDSEQRHFLAQDYFDFQRKSEQPISFADIEASYRNGAFIKRPDEHAMLNSCVLYGVKPVCVKAKEPNLAKIKQSLINFLDCCPYANTEREGIFYGIRFIDILARRYRDDPGNISLKHCHFLYCHIRLMADRVRILQKSGSLPPGEEPAASLDGMAVYVRNLEMRLLKSRMSPRAKSVPYGRELGDIKERYAQLIEEILRLMP